MENIKNKNTLQPTMSYKREYMHNAQCKKCPARNENEGENIWSKFSLDPGQEIFATLLLVPNHSGEAGRAVSSEVVQHAVGTLNDSAARFSVCYWSVFLPAVWVFFVPAWLLFWLTCLCLQFLNFFSQFLVWVIKTHLQPIKVTLESWKLRQSSGLTSKLCIISTVLNCVPVVRFAHARTFVCKLGLDKINQKDCNPVSAGVWKLRKHK